MKKLIMFIIVLVVTLVSCYFVYKHFTKDKIIEKPEEDIVETPDDDQDIVLIPRVDASLATQPLMDAFVEHFGGKEKLEDITYSNTHPAYVKLINDEVDLIIVTEPSEEEINLAKENNVELEVTKLVNEGFVFFVNSQNKVDNIELNKIVDIYSGKITNWKDVGGNNSNIIAYQRPVNSGSQTGMLSLVMKGVKMKEPVTEEMVESMGGIVDIVADYDNNIDGIGYSYYYYANAMYNTPNIKFLGINGIYPSYETIQNETYPLMTAYYIVTRKDADLKTKKFKELLLSSEGVKVAKGVGYVPIS